MTILAPVTPHWDDGFLRNLRREGTPDRVYHSERGYPPLCAPLASAAGYAPCAETVMTTAVSERECSVVDSVCD